VTCAGSRPGSANSCSACEGMHSTCFTIKVGEWNGINITLVCSSNDTYLHSSNRHCKLAKQSKASPLTSSTTKRITYCCPLPTHPRLPPTPPTGSLAARPPPPAQPPPPRHPRPPPTRRRLRRRVARAATPQGKSLHRHRGMQRQASPMLAWRGRRARTLTGTQAARQSCS
jgi:hypothetical protein